MFATPLGADEKLTVRGAAAGVHVEPAPSTVIADDEAIFGAGNGKERARSAHGDHAIGGRTGIADHQLRTGAVNLQAAPGFDAHHALLIDRPRVRVGQIASTWNPERLARMRSRPVPAACRRCG